MLTAQQCKLAHIHMPGHLSLLPSYEWNLAQVVVTVRLFAFSGISRIKKHFPVFITIHNVGITMRPFCFKKGEER